MMVMIKRKIVTSHIFPPIPTRTFDWCAYFDGEEERWTGFGSTVDEAVADLYSQIDTDKSLQFQFEQGELTLHDAVARLIRIGTEPKEAIRMANEWADAMEALHGPDDADAY